MDGVLTETAWVHAAAWKQLFDEYLERRAGVDAEFEPFDPVADYRNYVDGKLRQDGIISFLASRGIELPYGRKDDGHDQETVCGLGNRKNYYFRDWLTRHTVTPTPGAVALVRSLREARIKLAAFSASRNAPAVLGSAGLLSLFDTIVDGNDAARLGLSGKPDPAILLEAAARLRVSPVKAAVFEDAISGVTAGKRAGFRLVVGIASGDNVDALKRAGAHRIVGDLTEVRLLPNKGLIIEGELSQEEPA
jgi:alpha,alpha-trehalase